MGTIGIFRDNKSILVSRNVLIPTNKIVSGTRAVVALLNTTQTLMAVCLTTVGKSSVVYMRITFTLTAMATLPPRNKVSLMPSPMSPERKKILVKVFLFIYFFSGKFETNLEV